MCVHTETSIYGNIVLHMNITTADCFLFTHEFTTHVVIALSLKSVVQSIADYILQEPTESLAQAILTIASTSDKQKWA